MTGYHDQHAKDLHLDWLLAYILRRAMAFADTHLKNLWREGLIGDSEEP
jgi:hypothetical protein